MGEPSDEKRPFAGDPSSSGEETIPQRPQRSRGAGEEAGSAPAETVETSPPRVVVEDGELADETEELARPAPSRAPPSGAAQSRGGGSGSGPGAGSTGAATTTFSSPLEALRYDEFRRSRKLALTGVTLSALVAAAVPFLDASPLMTGVVLAGLAAVFVTNAWLLYICADPSRWVSWKIGVIWVASALGITCSVLFFGVFSPAPMVHLLGIYFISLGNDKRIALSVYLTSAITEAVFGLLFAFQILPDPGLIHAEYRPVHHRLVAVLLIQAVLLYVYLLARSSQKTTLDSMTEFDRAVRAVAQREALLQEARQDLERALQVGGAGRFTGQTLGSFRLGNVIGRGAMGEVYEASHKESGEQAAVKLLQPAMLSDPGYVKRFLREVEVASTLSVEHVVEVLEVSDPQAPFPYLAMERLDGYDLAHLLRTERRLSRTRVLDLVEQVGRGLRVAGEAGIVHRDVKPQNLFLARAQDGRRVWKILDFGVSKLAEHHGTLTQGNIVGTPVYMAPEQASGKDVDHRSDLYALAAIAYRCLSGHLPFRAKDVPSILYQVVYEMPPRPTSLVELPADTDAVMAIALAKEPRHRFDTAEELHTALAAALYGELDETTRSRGRRLEREHPWRND